MSAHEHERLSAYLDGELAAADRVAVEAHVTTCPECAARLAEFAAVDEASAALAPLAPSGYFEALPGRLRARLQPRPAVRRLPAWTWAAAAALLLAVVTPLTLSRRPAAESGAATREIGAAAAAAPGAAGEKEKADRRRAEATPALQPNARPAPVASAAPASKPVPKSEQGFAATPAETDTRQPVETAPTAEARREPASRAPAPGALSSRADAAPARDAAAVVAHDEIAAREKAQAPYATEQKAAGAPADVEAQAAPSARTAAAQARLGGRMADNVAEALASSGSEDEWRRLELARPQTAAEWRKLREQLRRFAAAASEGPHADAARARTVEAGYQAWRAGGDAADEAVFRRDAAAYLDREDAQQKPRVRELLR